MLFEVHIVALIVASLLAVAVESIWYAPTVFGRVYGRTTTHIFDEQHDAEQSLLYRSVVKSFCAHALFLFAVVTLLKFLIEVELSYAKSMVLIIACFAGCLLVNVTLERKQAAYFLIQVGYIAVVVFGGSAVIMLWPW